MANSPEAWKKQELKANLTAPISKITRTKVTSETRVPAEPIKIAAETEKLWELTLAEGWHRGK